MMNYKLKLILTSALIAVSTAVILMMLWILFCYQSITTGYLAKLANYGTPEQLVKATAVLLSGGDVKYVPTHLIAGIAVVALVTLYVGLLIMNCLRRNLPLRCLCKLKYWTTFYQGGFFYDELSLKDEVIAIKRRKCHQPAKRAIPFDHKSE